MILFLNTAEFEKLTFALVGDKVQQKSFKFKHSQSEKTLSYLAEFLESANKNFKKKDFSAIRKIVVVSGPGSFTGIRVGISLALAFSAAWQVPAYAVEAGNVPTSLQKLASMKLQRVSSGFEPDYGKQPNITFPKRNNRINNIKK